VEAISKLKRNLNAEQVSGRLRESCAEGVIAEADACTFTG
jgi:hypothetical protein